MSDDWPHEHTEERMAIAAVSPKTEPELLGAIDHADHATRLVYADWLEEQGDHERAEYMRLQDSVVELADGGARDIVRQRIIELDRKLDAAWRVIVARPQIVQCKSTSCPGDWGSLAPTHRTDMRVCGQCKEQVQYHFGWYERRTGPFVMDGYYERNWVDDLATGEWPPVRLRR